MEIFLFVLAGLLMLIGLAGSVLPVLPGIPISYAGLIALHLTDKVQYSTTFLVIWAVVVVLIQVLDYYVPIWGTKKFGGSKGGVWGSTIGLVAGMFFGPLGIVFGPFVGALIGELLSGKQSKYALKAAFGAFVGFLIGTVSKLIVGGVFIYYFVVALF